MDHHQHHQGVASPTSRSSKASASTQGTIPKHELNLSADEEENYDQEYEIQVHEVQKVPSKSGEYYYQDYKYVRPTQTDFDRKEVKDSKLFDETKKIGPGLDDEDVEDVEPLRDPSILVTGFGMRNVSSFQELLRLSQEERKKRDLRKLWRDKKEQERIAQERKAREEAEAAASFRSDTTEASTSTASSKRSSTDFLTQTETTARTHELANQRQKLDYLLGLASEIEEEQKDNMDDAEVRSEDDFKYSSSKSIREAQKYLRVHRVFECFQFIVAHLLSANAENPIEFILNLLNKCLLYRSGLGEAPLLYEKKHIGQLFNLMDRLQSGLIDYTQYKTGMKTLGVCTFNETPDMNSEDLIAKDTFIEEAYEAEVASFNELIRRHLDKTKTKDTNVTSFKSVSVPSINPPFFIPSELLFRKKVFDQPDYCEG